MRSAVAGKTTTPSKGYVLLTFRVYPERAQWVSECAELGTASCGDSIEEALANIKDATVLYLNTIEGNGSREKVFRQRGIKVVAGEPPGAAEVRGRARPNELLTAYVHPIAA